jgi:tetratricopeptide (TPR) repeat protein
MSEAIVNTISEANAEMYDRLLVSIEAGIGLLQIFIAVCDADRQREQIIAEYERELAPAIGHYRVELDPQEPSLRHAVASVVTAQANTMVTVLGAETLGLSGQSDESLDKFFGYLQWTREALREFQIPIVLWIPSRIFKELTKRSPDFWSWRNGVFQFQLAPALTQIEIADPRIEIERIDKQPTSILSIEQLESSLSKAIAKWGTDSSNVATLYARLGKLYSDRVRAGKSADRERELALAQDYFNRAIELQTKFQQPEDLATSLNELATLYESIGRYAQAEPLYVRSLAIREEQLGANHPDTATSLNNLANLYRATGRYAEAEPLYVRSLAINEHELGANHPSTAASLNNLAGLYKLTGRYAEAEPLYVRSLAIKEQELGANHPDTATSLNDLALLYRATGRYAEAEPLYVRSLAIREQELGANHPDTAISLNNLALLYESAGRYAEAESLFVRSLAIKEQELGDNHPSTATSLNNLALLYKLTGRYAEAEPLYVRSLAIMEQELGANHPSTATSLNNLAILYKSTGRYAEAEPLYVRSLAIRVQELGANHPDTAASLNNLAYLYESTGRYAEAEPLYLRALAILEQSLGTNHPNTQACYQNLQILRQQLAQSQAQLDPPRMNWWQWLREKLRS